MKKFICKHKNYIIAAVAILALAAIILIATSGHPWRIAEPPVGAWIGITEEEAELLRAGCTLPPDTNAVQVTAKPEQ